MTKYLEQIFPIECKGRSINRAEFLENPVQVEVRVYKNPDSNTISSEVKCLYNPGSHGERCNATTDRVFCPYSFDIPYALDNKR